MYTLFSPTCVSTIQYYLVILHFFIKRCSLQDFEPGISTPIEQVKKIAIHLNNELWNYSVNVSTFFIPIRHVKVPGTRVELHCVSFAMDSVKPQKCALTGKCATCSATLSCKNLPLRLLSRNIFSFTLSRIGYTVFMLSRYYCVVSVAV